jgi:hypothetical protein
LTVFSPESVKKYQAAPAAPAAPRPRRRVVFEDLPSGGGGAVEYLRPAFPDARKGEEVALGTARVARRSGAAVRRELRRTFMAMRRGEEVVEVVVIKVRAPSPH